MRNPGYLFAAFVMASCVPATRSAEQVFHHEHVLGTSLELRVTAGRSETSRQAETLTLQTIDRLSKVLSAYDSDSAFSRWQRGELDSADLPKDLRHVLDAAKVWKERSAGAFEIRSGVLTALWEQAARDNRLPTDAERSTCVNRLQTENDPAFPVSIDGLAKGYILDEVCRVVRQQIPDVESLTINIGGDVRCVGHNEQTFSVSDPLDASENSPPLLTFESPQPIALAASGGYRRSFNIQGRRFSHIIDPRTGFPQHEVLSATVVAPTAIDADAAATALCVLGPEAGLAMIHYLDGFECAIVQADGRLILSDGWPASAIGRSQSRRYLLTSDESKARSGLLVDFKLERPKGQRYRRPYVAVWLEDKDGFPVKTALLWIQTDQPGPRWHRDLTRWYRNDRMRLLVEQEKLIGTVSSATRGPGEYSARFDGKDNEGKPLAAGQYTLCIEAAREHGTYQLIREAVNLGETSIPETRLKGNVEVSEASFSYTPW